MIVVTIKLGLAWLGLAWLGLAWLGLVWFGLVWFGLPVIDRGFINAEIQMYTNVLHIFAIGDIVGQSMPAHKVHEAHVAAEFIAHLAGRRQVGEVGA